MEATCSSAVLANSGASEAGLCLEHNQPALLLAGLLRRRLRLRLMAEQRPEMDEYYEFMHASGFRAAAGVPIGFVIRE